MLGAFKKSESSTSPGLEAVERSYIALHSASQPNVAPRTKVNLPEDDIRQICLEARRVFLSQPMLVEVDAPVIICGDTHGQFYDLLHIFSMGGWPPEQPYLFLGDYVDRANQSIETISILLCLKIKFPDKIWLLRGNHECAAINRIYGFFDECKRRYSVRLWKQFAGVFDCMPVAGLVESKILCMHGGISKEMTSLDDIRSLARPTDVPDIGLLCDLLWADPEPDIVGWRESDRGVSYVFGGDVLSAFLEEHDLSLIARAHQVVEDGYEFFHDRSLVTIFSAPNYCGEFDNAGGMMLVKTNDEDPDDLVCSFKILKPSERRKYSLYYKR